MIECRARDQFILPLHLAAYGLGHEFDHQGHFVSAARRGLHFGYGEVIAVAQGKNIEVHPHMQDESILSHGVDDRSLKWFPTVPDTDRHRVNVVVDTEVELTKRWSLRTIDKRRRQVRSAS